MDPLTLLLLVMAAMVICWLLALLTDSSILSLLTIGLCLWGLYLAITYPTTPTTVTIPVQEDTP